MINNLYQRIKAGETILAEVTETGKEFTIKPAYSSKYMTAHVLGYSILADGEIVPGHNGTLLDKEVIDEWAADLTERPKKHVVDESDAWLDELNADYCASRGC